MVGHPGPGEPVAPEVRGRGEPGVGIVDVLGRRQLLGPRERAEDLLSLLERVPRPDPVALDPERHVGAQADRLPGAGRVGGLPVVAGQGPFGRRAAVIEGRFADQLELDAALDAERRAHEQMLAVLVGRRPGVRRDPVLALARAHGERVADQHPTRRRVPGGRDDVRARLVDACRWHVDPEGPEAEGAVLAVEQGAEDARRVEPRHAEPVDRARRARPGRRCGSSRGSRSRRSAGMARAPLRSGAQARPPACCLCVRRAPASPCAWASPRS